MGQRLFETETGIARHAWRGKYWRTWGEALAEAGFAPNQAPEPHDPAALTLALVKLTRKNKRVPTMADIGIERTSDPAFPPHQAFVRAASAAERIEWIRAFATEHDEFRDVLALLPPPSNDAPSTTSDDTDLNDGHVYLVKHGQHYKIGHTFDVPRRHREIALELPEKLEPVHTIATDDPEGIEAYWHKRFAARHTNGEWFALTRDDVRAFKSRKRM